MDNGNTRSDRAGSHEVSQQMTQFRTPLVRLLRALSGAALALGLVLFAGLGLALVLAAPLSAQQQTADPVPAPLMAPAVPIDPGFAALNMLMTTDPDAALLHLSDLLAALQADATSDPRVIFDLYTAAAGLLLEGGQPDQAAQVMAQIADFATRFRAEVDRDPIPLHAAAAALLEDTDQPQPARDSLLSLIAAQRAAGAGEAELAPALEALARVSSQLGEPAEAPATPPTPAKAVTVLYATDRAPTGDPMAQGVFGAERGALQWGAATVRMPLSPDLPGSLRQVTPWTGAAGLAAQLNTGGPVLLYVHGYNTPFEQAARRAARLARALGADSVPVLFSWPSQGSAIGYVPDTSAARAASRDLAQVLRQAQAAGGPVHLVAEGMGARPLLSALDLLAAGEAGAGFGQLLLVAPDESADLLRATLPAIRPLVRRITLYASDADPRLAVAQGLYGRALRAGAGGDAALTLPGMETIDLSALGPQTWSPALLADLSMLIWRDADPARRCDLQRVEGGAEGAALWQPQPGVCDDPALLPLLADLRRAGVNTPAAARARLAQTVDDPAQRQKLAPVIDKLLRAE